MRTSLLGHNQAWRVHAGVLSLWSEAGKRLAEDKATHGRAVSALQWSPDGSRLVTGDESGKVSAPSAARRASWRGDGASKACMHPRACTITRPTVMGASNGVCQLLILSDERSQVRFNLAWLLSSETCHL